MELLLEKVLIGVIWLMIAAAVALSFTKKKSEDLIWALSLCSVCLGVAHVIWQIMKCD